MRAAAILLRLLLCGLLPALYACAAIAPAADTEPGFTLLSPASLGAELSAYQQLRWTRAGERQQLDIALDIRSNSLQMVVLSPHGRRLATLGYQQGSYRLQREAGAPANIPYRQLLVYLQWIFWPLEALNNANINSGWHFQQRQQRCAWYDGELIACIDAQSTSPWSGRFHYRNNTGDIELSLQSVLLP
jgi:hypothetical protein